MKKLLGISLVAVLAATPLMAMADPVGTGTTPAHYTPANEEDTGSSVTASTTPKYQLMAAHDNDANAASAGYVKGAYNAAIKAVNAVHDEVASITSDALTTAGDGLAKDGNTVSVNAGDGLVIDNDNVEVNTGAGIIINNDAVALNYDNSTITLDSNNKVSVGTINKGNIATADKSFGTGDYADDTNLTTQGYVDQAIDGITTDYAKKVGVTQTITNSTITVTDGKTVSTSLSGVDGITASTTVPIMNTWGSDVPATTPLAATTTVNASSLGVSSTLGGSITASITGATYAEPQNP